MSIDAAARIMAMFGFGTADPEIAQRARDWVGDGATLLDVRTPAEHASGHLPGSINVPVQELPRRLDQVPGERVVVYCRSGGRSASAAKILERDGRQVLDLGAMSNWGDEDGER